MARTGHGLFVPRDGSPGRSAPAREIPFSGQRALVPAEPPETGDRNMRMLRSLRHTAVLLIALSAYSLRAGAQAPELKWGPAPSIFPAGARMAVLSGDPSKSD